VCYYCGCRDMPLIREFIAEHEAVTDLAAEAAQALRERDVERCDMLLARLAELLEAHWRGEEDGLFAAMRGDETYTGYVDELLAEHRELRALLARADTHRTDDREHLLAAIDELHRHIAKEEDGLFPASLTALSGEEWNRAFEAWRRAHPGAAEPEPRQDAGMAAAAVPDE